MGTSFDKYLNKHSASKQDPLLSQLQQKLEADEALRWHEQPTPAFFTLRSTPQFLFAIPWTAFAVFWMFGASSQGGILFGLFGTPFVLIGVWMLSSPLIEFFKLRKTIYGITNKRAIIMNKNNINSIRPEEFKNIHKRASKNGRGNLLFFTNTLYRPKGKKTLRDGFFRIKNLKEAETLLRELKSSQ